MSLWHLTQSFSFQSRTILMRKFCRGFYNDDRWGHRAGEPNKAVICSLALARLRTDIKGSDLASSNAVGMAQKLLLFWRKPARRCWWEGVELEGVEGVEGKLKVWIRRVWTLEMVSIGFFLSFLPPSRFALSLFSFSTSIHPFQASIPNLFNVCKKQLLKLTHFLISTHPTERNWSTIKPIEKNKTKHQHHNRISSQSCASYSKSVGEREKGYVCVHVSNSSRGDQSESLYKQLGYLLTFLLLHFLASNQPHGRGNRRTGDITSYGREGQGRAMEGTSDRLRGRTKIRG